MTFDDLTEAEQDEVFEALRWIGYPASEAQHVDICESGQVYVGLTEILPRGSVEYAFTKGATP